MGLTGDRARLVEALTSVTPYWSPTPSPDGDRLACICDKGRAPEVWLARRDGASRPGPPFPGPVEQVAWSPGDAMLAAIVWEEGGASTRAFVATLSDGVVHPVTRAGDTATTLVWTPDGDELLCAVTGAGESHTDVWCYPMGCRRAKPSLLATGAVQAEPVDVWRGGSHVLVRRSPHRGVSTFVIIDRATGHETDLFADQHEVTARTAGFGASPAEVLFLADPGRDTAFLGRAMVSGTDVTRSIVAARDDGVPEALGLHPARSAMTVVWNVEGGASEVETRDLGTGDVRARWSAGVRVVRELARGAPRTPVIHLGVDAATEPRAIWTAEAPGLDPVPLLRDAAPGFDGLGLVDPCLIRYRAADGEPLSAWHYRSGSPTGALVCSLHGGPERQERPRFDPTYQCLALSGIDVIAPNVRGSSGFGRRFAMLDDREGRFGAVRDVEDTVRMAVARGLADASRIGAMGASYGGFLVLAALARAPSLFAAAVDLFGITDFLRFFADTDPAMAASSVREYGDPVTDEALLRALSPLHAAHRIGCPLLVMHGARDTNVPPSQSAILVDALRARGADVRHVVFSDEGHGFSRSTNRRRMIEETTGWFTQHLL